MTNTPKKTAAVLGLFVLLAICITAISAGSPTFEAAAQARPTSTPPGVQTVALRAGPHPEPGGALENDSVRRLFSCKLIPAAQSSGFPFTSSAELPAMYSGARLRVDPADIRYVEAQPTLCAHQSTTPYQSFAIAPDGKYNVPSTFQARGKSARDDALIALPLQAYMWPGVWHLGVNDPYYFEIEIEVLRPARPFFLSDVSHTGLIGGFGGGEPVKGILFAHDNSGPTGRLTYQAEFDLTADPNGYALLSIPNVMHERLEDEYLLFVGQQRHFALSSLLDTTLKLNAVALESLEDFYYNAYWIAAFITPTAIVIAPTTAPTPNIPADRQTPPANSIRLGEFQVEQYCTDRGYGVKLINNENDWACTNPSDGSVVLTLGPRDFDAICQKKYNNPGAFAIYDQRKTTQAYNWSCYALNGVLTPPVSRDVAPANSIRLGEFQVEQYCTDQGHGVTLVNNQNDWACTDQPNGNVLFILGPRDFDAICQKRYNNLGAFAIRDQRKPQAAYDWSCYAYAGG